MESKFDCLIKNLIILSSEKENQINLIGFGNVGTEMLINFGLSNQNSSEFLMQKDINEMQKLKLDEFESNIDSNKNLDDNLDSDEWKKTRKSAKMLLEILDANSFKVELDKTGKYWKAKLIK